VVWLASDEGLGTGKFWLDRRVKPIHLRAVTRRSDTEEESRRLWDWVVGRGGLGPLPLR
jgi:hypothetical protein